MAVCAFIKIRTSAKCSDLDKKMRQCVSSDFPSTIFFGGKCYLLKKSKSVKCSDLDKNLRKRILSDFPSTIFFVKFFW